MAVPDALVAGGWIPFIIVIIGTLLFSFVYIRCYQSKYESQMCSTIVSILALSVALLTSDLVPVDIFIASYMKDSSGLYKDWANTTSSRRDIENSVLDAYYSLYCCELVFLFLILPFTYFYFEEKDDDQEISIRSRICTAAKYCTVFLLLVSTLMLIGAFAPFKSLPSKTNDTDTEWYTFIADEIKSTGAEDALSFTLGSLTLIGLLGVIFYTGYGMCAWPMDLVKGRRNIKVESLETEQSRQDARQRREAIRNKWTNTRDMTQRDREILEDAEQSDHLLGRREQRLTEKGKGCLGRLCMITRPIEILLGVFFFLVALLIFISLFLTNIDKAIHSKGPKAGYVLPKRTLPNPADITLVLCQQAFPLDYILMTCIVLYFFFCSMAGIRHIGIWFFWIKMYKIRPRKTRPQALLMLCMILMFVVLGINVIIYELTPQYSMYGNQHYQANKTYYDYHKNTTVVHYELTSCSTEAGDQCQMTRMTMLLTRFFYKVWFYGACYYWATWLFLVMIVISFLVVLIKRRRSSIEGEIEDTDFDDNDEDVLRA